MLTHCFRFFQSLLVEVENLALGSKLSVSTAALRVQIDPSIGDHRTRTGHEQEEDDFDDDVGEGVDGGGDVKGFAGFDFEGDFGRHLVHVVREAEDHDDERDSAEEHGETDK